MTDFLRPILCNKCGKELKAQGEVVMEDFLYVNKKWGYFSGKDGRTQEFILCESCVKQLEKQFAIPSKWKDTTELL